MIKQQAARFLVPLWVRLPEGRAKNAIRRRMYGVRVGIPRELLINPGDTVIQVGMWRLASLKRAAKAVGPTGRLILIEASSVGARQAQEFFAANAMTHCEAIHGAGWHESGYLDLQLTDDPSGNQVDGVKADLPHASSENYEQVPALMLDDVARERGIDRVDYLEVTVNGAELNVLQGAPNLLPNVQRILAAGMMRDSETKEPLNQKVSAYLQSQGFRTIISRRGRQVGSEWGRIDGHVFASRV